ncbi:DUF6493 family protein [Sphaerisporangium dianthi]|uniref:DUF6493 family protein n=1 Tax=Sphaerisporangium dianthi TaxID=1436120 RepID=A0ABV9CTE8_9ACTN
MTAWDDVRGLIDAGDAVRLADRLTGLTAGERKAVSGELREYIPVIRARARALREERWEEESRLHEAWSGRGRRVLRREPWEDWPDLMRLAGAGTISAVTAVAAWVTRRDLLTTRRSRRPAFGDPGPIVQVLAHRPAEWQAELAVRLAAKVRGPRDTGAPLALAMLRHTGAEPPPNDALVVAWVAAGVGSSPAWQPPGTARPEGVRPGDDTGEPWEEEFADPLLPVLLPRLFEAEGVGRALRDERLDPISPWLRTIRDVVESGAVAREPLLDGCVRRLLRGGAAPDLRFFARVHELLAPSAAEVEARRRDYLSMLPAAPGPVAEVALRHLRGLPEHELEDVAEAIGGLLFRAEVGLVKAGMTWFDHTVRHDPARADGLAPALATAFHHESYDVQGRAAQLALKHAGRFGPLGGEHIRDAIPALPPELGRRVAEVFGGEAVDTRTEPPFVPRPLPEPPPVMPFPATPAAPAEMEALGWTQWQWQPAERWLAGFVHLTHHDRLGLRAALQAAYGTAYSDVFAMRVWTATDFWRAAMAMELITPGADPGVPADPGHGPWPSGWTAGFTEGVLVTVTPGGALADVEYGGLAGQEEAVWAEGDAQAHDGHDPDVFGRRYTDYAAGLPASWVGGAAPSGGDAKIGGLGPNGRWAAVPEPPRDRLPAPGEVSLPHMFVLRRFAEVLNALKEGTLPPVLLATPTSSTGALSPGVLVSRLEECEAAGVEPLPADLQQALLRLPRGVHAEAAARVARLTSEAARTAARWMSGGGLPDPRAGVRWGYVEGACEHYFDERPDGRVGQIRLTPLLKAGPTGLALIDELLAEPVKWTRNEHGGCMEWWPGVLPSHREVVAVNLLPHLLYQWNRPGVSASHAAMLAAADGPAGEATALVLAYFLAQKRSDAGVSVLLTMAARGDLPARELGDQLQRLIRWMRHAPQHIVNALQDAADQGAHEEVWQVLRAMLPGLLPGPEERPRSGLAAAVRLAVTVAERAQVRDDFPEVAELAARKSTSLLTRQARRLHDHLTRP